MGETTRAWRQVGARIGAGLIIGFGAYQALLGLLTLTGAGPAAWGWVHLANGVLAISTGLYLLRDTAWTRRTAMVAAVLSGAANTVLLREGTLWPMLIVALDVVVIVCLLTLPAAQAATTPDAATTPEAAGATPADARDAAPTQTWPVNQPGPAAGQAAERTDGPADAPLWPERVPVEPVEDLAPELGDSQSPVERAR
jgi:hypothetical protein